MLDYSASFSGETVVHTASAMRCFAYRAFGELIEALDTGTQWDAILACDTLLQDVEILDHPGSGYRLCRYLRDPEVTFISLTNRRLLDLQDSRNLF